MKRFFWLVVPILAVIACGGETSTENTISPITDSSAVLAGSTDLSGIGFEVHQQPG